MSLFLADAACGPWRLVGSTRTDRDGRATVDLTSAQLGGVGAHPLRWVVHGDGARARGRYVVPASAPTVVFDVDGTLTTDDGEVFEELLMGRTAEVRPGGQDVVRRYVSAGYFVVYITGRPYMLRDSTRAWLVGQGFPPGPAPPLAPAPPAALRRPTPPLRLAFVRQRQHGRVRTRAGLPAATFIRAGRPLRGPSHAHERG
ncbi:MAG: hypothetical protein IPL19_01615 [Sandaracinaceae bacterium]|nr:hypothetical protein [Sandaracinaceae bacterium]